MIRTSRARRVTEECRRLGSKPSYTTVAIGKGQGLTAGIRPGSSSGRHGLAARRRGAGGLALGAPTAKWGGKWPGRMRCKPSSVPPPRRAWAAAAKAIYLDPPLRTGSSRPACEQAGRKSGLPAAVGLNHAGGPAGGSPPADAPKPLLGLAPGGVCRAGKPRGYRGALLPHLFTLTFRRRGFGRRYLFCGTFPIPTHRRRCGPGSRNGGCCPPPRFSGARTFLPSPTRAKSGLPRIRP